MARTVADAAVLLGALAGTIPRDPATAASAGQAQPTTPSSSTRTGCAARASASPREVYCGLQRRTPTAIAEAAIAVMRDAGADDHRPRRDPDRRATAALASRRREFEPSCSTSSRPTSTPISPASSAPAHRHRWPTLIAFNEQHADAEMPYFGQELLEIAEDEGPADRRRLPRRAGDDHRLARAGRHRRRPGRAPASTPSSRRPAARLADRPGQRRPLRAAAARARPPSPATRHHRPRRLRLRPAGRHHLHGPRLERADAASGSPTPSSRQQRRGGRRAMPRQRCSRRTRRRLFQ